MQAVKDILSGTVGGFAQVAVGHPLDTIKTRMQMQGQPGAEVYKGMMDCCTKMFQREGFSGFYAGAFSPLAGAAFHNASLFLWWGACARCCRCSPLLVDVQRIATLLPFASCSRAVVSPPTACLRLARNRASLCMKPPQAAQSA